MRHLEFRPRSRGRPDHRESWIPFLLVQVALWTVLAVGFAELLDEHLNRLFDFLFLVASSAASLYS